MGDLLACHGRDPFLMHEIIEALRRTIA